MRGTLLRAGGFVLATQDQNETTDESYGKPHSEQEPTWSQFSYEKAVEE